VSSPTAYEHVALYLKQGSPVHKVDPETGATLCGLLPKGFYHIPDRFVSTRIPCCTCDRIATEREAAAALVEGGTS